MKTLKSTLVLIIAIVLLAAPGQLLAKKKIELKYRLHQNDKFVTKSSTNQNIEMQNQGQTVDIQSITTQDVTTVVEKVAANSIATSSTIDKITLSQSVFGRKINYDSSDPSTYASGPAKTLGDKFNKMIGKSYLTVLDDLGHVISIDMSQVTGDENKVAGSLNSDDSYIVFPNHSVEVGDTWEAEIKPIKSSDMVVSVKYTLNKVSGNEAVIGIEAKISASKVADNNMTMSGVQNGEATVDIRNGWTTKLNLDQEVKMEVQQNGMSIPMTISGTITKTSEEK
ncbi:MAG: hypothetical protein IH595_08140 [Bacteroidales bacterium]|nr:hypothetical protein [Bacteroidales bacterium]